MSYGTWNYLHCKKNTNSCKINITALQSICQSSVKAALRLCSLSPLCKASLENFSLSLKTRVPGGAFFFFFFIRYLPVLAHLTSVTSTKQKKPLDPACSSKTWRSGEKSPETNHTFSRLVWKMKKDVNGLTSNSTVSLSLCFKYC